MTVQQRHFSRDLLVSCSAAIIAAIFGLAGWFFLDRIHWAAREQQIDDNASTVRDIKGKVDSLPNEFVTRQEFIQVQQLIQSDHVDTINAINHLSDRVDRAMLSRPRSAVQFTDPGGAANSKAVTAARE